MVHTLEGVFRNGRVELLGSPPRIEAARVLVTFLPESKRVNLADYGIGSEQAADLRARLSTFAEDWDRPEMDVYDEI